MELSW
jgi:hypothetical protein